MNTLHYSKNLGKMRLLRNKKISWKRFFSATLSLPNISLLMVESSLASNINLDPINNLLTNIVHTLTGPLGLTAATLAFIGCFISWFFGAIDFRQLTWVLVAIAGIGSSAKIVGSIWGSV